MQYYVCALLVLTIQNCFFELFSLNRSINLNKMSVLTFFILVHGGLQWTGINDGLGRRLSGVVAIGIVAIIAAAQVRSVQTLFTCNIRRKSIRELAN